MPLEQQMLTCCVVLAPVEVGLVLLQHMGTSLLNGLASQAFGGQPWGTAARLSGLLTSGCELQVRGMGATLSVASCSAVVVRSGACRAFHTLSQAVKATSTIIRLTWLRAAGVPGVKLGGCAAI